MTCCRTDSRKWKFTSDSSILIDSHYDVADDLAKTAVVADFWSELTASVSIDTLEALIYEFIFNKTSSFFIFFCSKNLPSLQKQIREGFFAIRPRWTGLRAGRPVSSTENRTHHRAVWRHRSGDGVPWEQKKTLRLPKFACKGRQLRG